MIVNFETIKNELSQFDNISELSDDKLLFIDDMIRFWINNLTIFDNITNKPWKICDETIEDYNPYIFTGTYKEAVIHCFLEKEQPTTFFKNNFEFTSDADNSYIFDENYMIEDLKDMCLLLIQNI